MESRTPPRIEEPRVVSFTGVYQHLIDACLQAYAPAQWTAFTQKVAALSQFDPSVRLLVRSFVAPAQECPVDKVGRILIPPPLREHAGLTDEVTWAGTVERIEIWSPARWLETQKAARAPEAQAQLAARLHQLL